MFKLLNVDFVFRSIFDIGKFKDSEEYVFEENGREVKKGYRIINSKGLVEVKFI